MDKIILSSSDVETLLQWRDNNINLVRRNAVPFKAIILEFPDTKINIKAINDGGRITFYIHINGIRAGKIIGLQLPGGLFKSLKNTTKLKPDDIQSIITVYASLMALIVYHEPAPTAPATKAKPPKKAKQHKQKAKPGKTYILKHSNRGPVISSPGGHASPAGVFSVRGHYRHYKDGRAVWIKPYKKGEGSQKNKTYKL